MLGARRRDRRRDVSVANQVDARARIAQLADQIDMAVALEHDDAHVGHAPALGLRDGLHVLGRRCVDVDRVDRVRADRDLVHVDRRAREEHRAALGDRDHGDRVRLAERRQAGALERVDGDVDRRASPLADVLAVVEHRRLVLLAFADHDDAVHHDGVEHRAHAVDRRLVGSDLVAAPDPAPGTHRSGLRDTDELERQVPVWTRGAHGQPS